MTDHYYSESPKSEHDINNLFFTFNNKNFEFRTDSGVFSKNEIDKGTTILLKTLPELDGKIIDMGCGYGVISIVLKSTYPNLDVYGIDINSRAIELAKYNAIKNKVDVNFIHSDGNTAKIKDVDYAIINPPIRAGKAVVYRLFSELQSALKDKGTMFIVIRTKQGAKSAVEYLKKLFKVVDTLEIKSGYRVLKCEEKIQ